MLFTIQHLFSAPHPQLTLLSNNNLVTLHPYTISFIFLLTNWYLLPFHVTFLFYIYTIETMSLKIIEVFLLFSSIPIKKMDRRTEARLESREIQIFVEAQFLHSFLSPCQSFISHLNMQRPSCLFLCKSSTNTKAVLGFFCFPCTWFLLSTDSFISPLDHILSLCVFHHQFVWISVYPKSTRLGMSLC